MIMFINSKSQLWENHKRQLNWSQTKHTQSGGGVKRSQREGKEGEQNVLNFKIPL